MKRKRDDVEPRPAKKSNVEDVYKGNIKFLVVKNMEAPITVEADVDSSLLKALSGVRPNFVQRNCSVEVHDKPRSTYIVQPQLRDTIFRDLFTEKGWDPSTHVPKLELHTPTFNVNIKSGKSVLDFEDIDGEDNVKDVFHAVWRKQKLDEERDAICLEWAYNTLKTNQTFSWPEFDRYPVNKMNFNQFMVHLRPKNCEPDDLDLQRVRLVIHIQDEGAKKRSKVAQKEPAKRSKVAQKEPAKRSKDNESQEEDKKEAANVFGANFNVFGLVAHCPKIRKNRAVEVVCNRICSKAQLPLLSDNSTVTIKNGDDTILDLSPPAFGKSFDELFDMVEFDVETMDLCITVHHQITVELMYRNKAKFHVFVEQDTLSDVFKYMEEHFSFKHVPKLQMMLRGLEVKQEVARDDDTTLARWIRDHTSTLSDIELPKLEVAVRASDPIMFNAIVCDVGGVEIKVSRVPLYRSIRSFMKKLDQRTTLEGLREGEKLTLRIDNRIIGEMIHSQSVKKSNFAQLFGDYEPENGETYDLIIGRKIHVEFSYDDGNNVAQEAECWMWYNDTISDLRKKLHQLFKISNRSKKLFVIDVKDAEIEDFEYNSAHNSMTIGDWIQHFSELNDLEWPDLELKVRYRKLTFKHGG